jgi:UDP-3-O-[3-hydroxymyristoyl] glucosamine N-acyltransferase
VTLRLGDIVSSLAGQFDARLVGDPGILIDRLAPLETAGGNELAFLSHPKYQSKLGPSAAACVIVAPAAAEAAARRGAHIVVDDPYFYFARVTQLWKKRHEPQDAPPGIHPSAFVDPTARLGQGVGVGAFACIGANAVLGDGVEVGAHGVIGRDVSLGAKTRLAPRVTVLDGCSLGERCLVHPGAVIGADGFGFAPHQERWEKIEQLGTVRIGNDVEIGANTCIDRGALHDTVIEDGVKLDNLVQIGHNVRIGRHTAMAGCAGVAGSAVIGAHCTVGGGAVILGHLTLADRVHVSAASVVTRSIHKPGHYTGLFPIDDNARWEKNAATLKQLHVLRERLKALEQASGAVPGKTPEKS